MAKINYGHTPTQKEIKEHLYSQKKAEETNAIFNTDMLYIDYGYALDGMATVCKRYSFKLKDEPYKALGNN